MTDEHRNKIAAVLKAAGVAILEAGKSTEGKASAVAAAVYLVLVLLASLIEVDAGQGALPKPTWSDLYQAVRQVRKATRTRVDVPGFEGKVFPGEE